MDEIKPDKRLGQHFLGSEATAQKIARHIQGEKVLEIGPGLGILTQFLIKKKLTAIEIDPRLANILKKRFGSAVKHGDALQEDFSSFDCVCGLLPYNLSAKIIEKFLKSDCKLGVFVVQKEVAERMVAKSGSGNYSRLSILVQNNANCRLIATYNEDEFWPKPRVKSSLVVLEKKKPLLLNQELVNALFQHKNQKVRKALKHSGRTISYSGPLLEKKVRKLTIEQLAELSLQSAQR